MNTRHAFAAVVALAGLLWQTSAPAQAIDRLSDAEFWALVNDASEPGGSFHSDNFTSNEANFPSAVAQLVKNGPFGGAYLGVGPEQNFHYIAAIKPAIGFVFDIRRQAVVQHLMYKALFELSESREEFIARLFSVEIPGGVNRKALPEAIWQKFKIAPGEDKTRLAANIAEVAKHLTQTHTFALSEDDLKSLEYVLDAFFRFGPAIDYSGGVKGLTTGNTNFQKITVAADDGGVPRSFLGSDENFQYLKSLHSRNLIVPIQADFGGPKTIRAVGDFLRARSLTVSAFYISNVEQYLFNPRSPTAPNGQETNGGWKAFYDNLATLPATKSTVLMRVPPSLAILSSPITRRMPDGTLRTETRPMFCPLLEFLDAVKAGKVTTQAHATACGR